MRVSQTRGILWAVGALAVTAAIGVVAAAVWMPLDLPTTAVSSSARTVASTRQAIAAGGGAMSLASFEAAWGRKLRRPLVDPPPPPVRVASAKTAKASRAAKVPVRLLGTIIDGSRSRGLFASGIATVELKGIGETIGGATVLAIEENSATVSYNGGEAVTLKRERTPFDPSGANYDTAVRTAVDAKRDAEGGS